MVNKKIHHYEIHPPRWARGGHSQTIWGHLLRQMEKPIPGGENLVIELADGDQLAARLYRGESGTVIYLFHGLASHSDAGYMIRTAKLLIAQGHSVMLVNHRGCGPDGLKLRQLCPIIPDAPKISLPPLR